jgi:hypothetical protein
VVGCGLAQVRKLLIGVPFPLYSFPGKAESAGQTLTARVWPLAGSVPGGGALLSLGPIRPAQQDAVDAPSPPCAGSTIFHDFISKANDVPPVMDAQFVANAILEKNLAHHYGAQ